MSFFRLPTLLVAFELTNYQRHKFLSIFNPPLCFGKPCDRCHLVNIVNKNEEFNQNEHLK
jgi:hypothetical protein